MVVPPVTTGTLVVFALIAVALVLFVTEVVPSDFTAIGVLVALAVLEPYTGVPAADAIAGFASPATVTILAMYILSEGVQQTGIVERLGVYLARLTGGDETRLLAATIGTTGLSAGIVNNTPVVAVFIPMVTGLAERARISPSKLLLPLSYAAMLGGTLTLIGTATNLLASDFAREIPGRGPIGMFEFTPLGVLVFIVGAAYLLTVGRRLTPERVPPLAALTEEFAVDRHLVRFGVPEDSALVGRGVDAFHEELDAQGADADLLQVERDGEGFHAQSSDQTLAAGDVLTFRATARTADRLLDQYGLSQPRAGDVSDDDLVTDASTVAEAVVLPDSALVGETPASAELDVRYDTTVLAVQRGDDLLRDAVETVELRAGDTLLLHTTPAGVDHLQARGDVSVTHVPEGELDLLEPDADEADVAPLSAKTPVAVGIIAVVVGLAALGVVPIVIAALGGVVAMVVTGCLAPADAYDAVSWNIVFLLAGVLPLGVAMQRTGGAAVVAGLLVESAHVLPIIAVLGLFYVLTGLFANVITPVASVVLMSPIAIDTATRVDADPFAFLLAVTFAASAAFMTPIGYQTNLMVYGPGGYRFTDYVRVGGPLQLLLAVVVTLAIPAFFGL